MWTRILALIYKEILAILRDKKSRMVIILPPLIQLILFTQAATLDVKNVPIGIVNRDSGHESFELIQRFAGSPFFTKLVYLDSVAAITPFIDNMEGVMVLSFDEQFSRNIKANKPATIQLILDGRKSNTAQIVQRYATSIVEQYNIELARKADARKAEVRVQNTDIIPRNWFNPNLLYIWYNIPSLCGILVMVVAIVLTALSVAREKEFGTFDQLLVSPVSPFEIIVGKTVPAILIGIVEGSIILFFGVFVYQVPFVGSLPLFYLSMLVFLFSTIGIGLFLSTLSNTQQQAVLGSFIFLSPAMVLSGFATPIENMPAWLQPFTYAVPLRYFLIISKGLFLKDLPASIVFNNLWPMVLIGIVTLSLSGWFFRHRLE